MRRVIANLWTTLDGVVQSPSYADEDRSGGFEHGGWHSRYFDETVLAWSIENLSTAGGYLLGRGTYEQFASYWPSAPDAEAVVRDPLNKLPKYVASTTLTGPLAWNNSTVLDADLGQAVAALKAEEGGDLLAVGSPGLVRELLALDLVDELRLMIDPVAVGGGKRLFADDGRLRLLRLTDSRVTGTGAIIATYEVGTEN